MQTRPELPLFVLAAIALVGIVVLTALGHPIPGTLSLVAAGALTGGAAGVVPSSSTRSSSSSSSTPAAAVDVDPATRPGGAA